MLFWMTICVLLMSSKLMLKSAFMRVQTMFESASWIRNSALEKSVRFRVFGGRRASQFL